MAYAMLRLLKPLLTRTVYREGTIATIRRGPARGLRYRIFSGFGLAPLWGGWEPDLQQSLVNRLVPGGVAYDIGANYGIHTILMAKLVGPAGHVYAFEPMPEIYDSLCENIALNGFRNTTTIPFALSNLSGETRFVTGHHAGAGHLADVGAARVGDTITVHTIPLDTFVYDPPGRRLPALIKIDIEGAESRALQGAARVLREARPILFMDLHGAEQQTSCGRILREHGYDIFATDNGRQILDVTSPVSEPDGMSDQIMAIHAGQSS